MSTFTCITYYLLCSFYGHSKAGFYEFIPKVFTTQTCLATASAITDDLAVPVLIAAAPAIPDDHPVVLVPHIPPVEVAPPLFPPPIAAAPVHHAPHHAPAAIFPFPGSFSMYLSPYHLRETLEIPVVFGDYLFYQLNAVDTIQVITQVNLVEAFDLVIHYRDYKHRAFVTKASWRGFRDTVNLHPEDRLTFELPNDNHPEFYLLRADRDGLPLW
ncbi:DNA-binding pseudobarrel domain containing protein [Parasponia andersonii]|uniref:DNA-binding pseudobarrel domain containing protein n=1 Tax=Parasponia andersonii TaxID=3476 RepID=A0A2P5AGW3_PARAD|nr:DNA-binding pseudobarrel domain containing protein [Parasponia andersonii]